MNVTDPLRELLLSSDWGLSESRAQTAHLINREQPLDSRQGVYASSCGQARVWEIEGGLAEYIPVCKFCLRRVRRAT